MLPCADVHWKILPSISRELATWMGNSGMPQTKIAAALGTTTAAVSQYVSGKRGGEKLGAKTKEACRKLAKKIAAGTVAKGEINSEIARIIVIAKGSKMGKNDPCSICMSH